MNMKKTLVASALAVALGGASAVQANTTGLTGVWTGTYSFSMSSPNGGPVGAPTAPQAWTFYASVWTAHDVTFSDNGTSYGPAGGAGTVNMLFDWSVNANIPVTSDWDVTATGTSAVVTVNSVTITALSPAFPGFHPAFNGTLNQVPVPAAVWLMGSGLLGLVGVARRRRKA